MTQQEFIRELGRARLLMEEAMDFGATAAGDGLTHKNHAFAVLEKLATALEIESSRASWTKEEASEAMRGLIDLRVAVENQARYEEIRSRMGRVLSDAAGIKELSGAVYSQKGTTAAPPPLPASRIDRIS